MSTATSSAQSLGFQEAMQKFGRFLSGMVLPNIGAFIAWGFLTALFIPTGWLPNEYLAQVGGPMSKWLIPLLLGYSGGAAVYKHRGGVVGTIATAGVIAGADIPMFLGAMIMGPLAGYLMKKFDAAIEDKIPTGFEMLVNNFSAGILGGVLAVLAFVGVGPVVLAANGVLRSGVEGIVAAGLLPLASVIIEPAKILFLNNAINHTLPQQRHQSWCALAAGHSAGRRIWQVHVLPARSKPRPRPWRTAGLLVLRQGHG